ncbi:MULTISPECIES: hypothetical protein [unclassified Streptomyces]|uniref:hypothetical protein n=1 Tax=unclassified Streptomyces TaxID=2593676 RepID=UPI0004BD565D|nr:MULTISPECIES: hypothetical protein [unclassified Streptomyces]
MGAARHGVDAARRLAEAEGLADAVAKEIIPANTTDTYAKSSRACWWRCGLDAARGPTERHRLRHRLGLRPWPPAVVGLRQRGALEVLVVKFLPAGGRRGRGQAVGADLDALRAVV